MYAREQVHHPLMRCSLLIAVTTIAVVVSSCGSRDVAQGEHPTVTVYETQRDTSQESDADRALFTATSELTYDELVALGLDHGPYSVRAYGETAGNPIYTVSPGQKLTIPFTVENFGDLADSYDITVASSSSLVDAGQVPSTLDLEPGEKRDFVLLLRVPSGQPAGLLDEIEVRVASRSDYSNIDSFRATVKSRGPALAEPGASSTISTTTTQRTAADSSGRVLAVDVTEDGYLALCSDGSLWAWGDVRHGDRGNGETPISEDPVRIGSDSDWVAMSLDGMWSLALKADGSLWGWGRELPVRREGAWAVTDSSTPICLDSESAWAAVSACWGHVLALQEDGSLWAWGYNGDGRLGTGDPNNRLFPVKIGSDHDWTKVAASETHSLALKKDGSLWAWGVCLPGGKDDATVGQSLVPARVGSESDWVAVSAGQGYSLALKKDGSLWGWGLNDFGQLGDGTTGYRAALTHIGSDSDWVAVSAGWRSSLAVKKDGSLWGWGSDMYGGMGGGYDEQRLVTTRIGSDSDWMAVDGDWENSAALKKDGSVWIWSFAQLGTGVITTHFSPVRVLGPAVETSTSYPMATTTTVFRMVTELSVAVGSQGVISNEQVIELLGAYFSGCSEVPDELPVVAMGIGVLEQRTFGDWAVAEGLVMDPQAHVGWGAVFQKRDGTWVLKYVQSGSAAEMSTDHMKAMQVPPEVIDYFRFKPIPEDVPYKLPG
jgi:alpha-tubulin suppressor-like RCC1 family protein